MAAERRVESRQRHEDVERRRERAAVDGYERRALARPVEVDRARDELLAGAGLALDEYGCRKGGDFLNRDEYLLHRLAPADDSGVFVFPRELLAESQVLDGEALLGVDDLAVKLGVFYRDRRLGRERGDNRHIVFRERGGEAAAVGVYDADDRFLEHQRHADGPLELQVEDALLILEPVVLQNIRDKEGFAALRDVVHDAEADGERFPFERLLVPVARDLEFEGTAGVGEHEEAAVRVRELDRRIDDLLEHFVEIEGRAERLRDIGQHLELLHPPHQLLALTLRQLSGLHGFRLLEILDLALNLGKELVRRRCLARSFRLLLGLLAVHSGSPLFLLCVHGDISLFM